MTHVNIFKESNLSDDLCVPHIFYLISSFDIDYKELLKIYNIKTISDGLNVIQQELPYNTQNRILECMWNLHINNEELLSFTLVEIYEKIIKTKWIKYFYYMLKNKISIDTNSNKIYLVDSAILESIQDTHKIEKTNYIVENILTKNNIYFALQKFIELYGNRVIPSYEYEIKQTILKYIFWKINQ
jgi:hypothetical protein